jgi:hypothetical protein
MINNFLAIDTTLTNNQSIFILTAIGKADLLITN